MSESSVHFEPRWKEELVCTMDGKNFVVEMTMGIVTVYFPTKSAWQAATPYWAQSQWERVSESLAAWCLQQKIPLVIEETAWVNFD